MAELNEPQARAAMHEAGPLLVFAGAGSGKTRAITYRIANLLATHRVPPYRILAVTFTNKAAGEMRERLIRLAGEEIVRDLWVGTFHSVCARLLRRYHDEVSLTPHYVIYDDSDQKAVLSRILKEGGYDERRYPAKYVLSRIHAEKREGREPEDVDLSMADDTLVELYEKYQKGLRAANAVDFDDLLSLVARIAEDPNSAAGQELRRRYLHVLVDEFQDTNAVQYRLVRALSAASRNLCVVGDDDQSIYRWRGADVRIIRGFKRDFPDATVIKLEQNYRSTGNIVKAALGVIQHALDREPKELWTAAEAGDKVVVYGARDDRDEAGWVARGVLSARARSRESGGLAVFYRVHAQSRVLEEALRQQGIHYQVIGGMKFFERAEVKDALAYLRLIENPKSDADLLRIINVPVRGIGAKTVERLLDVAAESSRSVFDALEPCLSAGLLGKAAHKKLADFKALLADLQKAREQLSPSELLDRVLEQTGYRLQLQRADSTEADARLENLQELMGSLIEYEKEQEKEGKTPDLSGYLERISLVAAVDTMSEAPSVSLMTVHSAKGLEFDTVWLVGMEEEVFPYKGLSDDNVGDLDEERRLAYVAVTRARQKLYVSHVQARNLFGQTRYLLPSRFIQDLPEDVVSMQGLAKRRRMSPSFERFRAEAAPTHAPGERFLDTDVFDDTSYDYD